MKNLTRALLGAAALVGTFTGSAYAQDEAPAWAVSAAVAVQSDYRFRGISQNDRDPAPQGTINITGPDGWYVGTWLSKTNWMLGGANDNPGFEMDIYGGKHFDLYGTDLNVQALYYAYPDADTFGGSKASYFESVVQLTHVFGPLTVMASWNYSPEFSLGGGTGNWLAGTGTFVITDWLTASANVGHQWVQAAKYFGSSDYTEYDVGLTASYSGFALDLRYVDTDLSKLKCANFYMATQNACEGGFVATLTYSFALFP